MGNEVFISYCRADIKKVYQIKEEIDREVGIDCWMDLESIECHEQFVNVIVDAINAHNTMLFMMSKNSMQRKWALDELALAERRGKRIVLIKLDNAEMPDNFYFLYHHKQQIDWNNKLQHDKLIKDLKNWFSNGISASSSQDTGSISQAKLLALYYEYFFALNGKEQDLKEAVKKIRKAAEQGNNDAITALKQLWEV